MPWDHGGLALRHVSTFSAAHTSIQDLRTFSWDSKVSHTKVQVKVAVL